MNIAMQSLLIVVPTLDSYKLLPRLVASLKQQTFSNWKLLFVDGPSSKNHRDWIKSCCESDKRFSWIQQSSDNKGIYGAMNQGFETIGDNEWILFWGSDDWAISSTVLSKIVNKVNITWLK